MNRVTKAPKRRTLVWVLALAVIAVDTASKVLAVRWWSQSSVDAGPAHLHVVRNSGGPFGLAPHATAWFTLVALIAVPLFARVASRVESRTMLYGLGLVLGGTVGNVVDRLVRVPEPFRGAVVDWLRVSPYRPVFNIADIALRVGGALLIVALLRSDRTSKVETATSPG